MRIHVWEVVAALGAALLALLFLYVGDVFGGGVLLALVAFAVAVRTRPRDEAVAGSFALSRGALAIAQAAALFVLYGLAVAAMFVAAVERWSSDTKGKVAVYALMGVMVLLLREIRRRGDEGFDWIAGGRAEQRVAQELDPLRALGWTVVHNVLKERGGNVDHIVWGPRGAYAIETKSGNFHRSQLGQAKANAAWSKEKFGARWVEPVISAAGADELPRQQSGVWIVAPDQLRVWLLDRPLRATELRSHAGGDDDRSRRMNASRPSSYRQ
jgi:hypothetical protein